MAFRAMILLLATAWCTDASYTGLTARAGVNPRANVVAGVTSWYDSGIRLTPNGGAMDTKVVPPDEERWGGELTCSAVAVIRSASS